MTELLPRLPSFSIISVLGVKESASVAGGKRVSGSSLGYQAGGRAQPSTSLRCPRCSEEVGRVARDQGKGEEVL